MGGNVEAIKERLDIAEVIGGYIKLEKAGANFKAKCPFHNEKTASFFISPLRQSYYCFGCGVKGDIFTFVEEMEGTDFRGALKTLADRAGVELKYERREGKDDKEKLFSVMHDAMEYYQKELEKNAEPMKYLELRGVDKESIKSWKLGFAEDDWRRLREYMHGLGYKDDVLSKAGLIKTSVEGKEKEPYDTFRGRVMFPLFDPRGEVIAFSGRALSKEIEPKYLNSPDTEIFKKNQVLYGFDRASEEIRRMGKDKSYAVLVEGQLDMVLSHQAGVRNTVASSGTAFTQAHLKMLKMRSPRITLAFDGDEAGLKATERSVALAYALGMEVKIAELPEGKDPADLVKENPENWKEVLRKKRPAMEVLLDRILKKNDQNKIGKMIERKLLPLIALMPSRIDKEDAVSLISRYSGKSPQVIIEEVNKIKENDAYTILDTEIGVEEVSKEKRTREEELGEVKEWLKEDSENKDLLRHKAELEYLIKIDELDEKISSLRLKSMGEDKALAEIVRLTKERDTLKRQAV